MEAFAYNDALVAHGFLLWFGSQNSTRRGDTCAWLAIWVSRWIKKPVPPYQAMQVMENANVRGEVSVIHISAAWQLLEA
jgi:hypothetical protein